MGLSFKLTILSATVLSTAIMFNLSSPFITTSDFPVIWTSIISWLKPPYLYVVINCIIITIVASSRYQSKIERSGSNYSNSTFHTPIHEPVKLVVPDKLPPVHGRVLDDERENIAVAGYDMETKVVEDVPVDDQFSSSEFAKECLVYQDTKVTKEAYEEITKSNNRVDKYVTAVSVWTPSDTYNQQLRLSFPVEKPPASARFNHRKSVKVSSDGGRTLGVTKPKRQDTLETTWKAITEGRSVPLTRHLHKSDTRETRENRSSDEFLIDNNHNSERMTKSETFHVSGRNSVKPIKPPPAPSKLRRSSGSGRLKKKPSLGQEELNRRVEAFIKKFNEDMRLQRQESLNQFMEMINRGAH